MKPRTLSRLQLHRSPVLSFAPLAWLKLQWFCHQGDTEIGGFGITDKRDPLYVEEFITVRQTVTSVSVRFEDQAVADFFDTCVDRGLKTENFARIWIHTHPGSSAEPSGTDEQTFARVFGSCDWSVMFILSRTARTYARLAFAAGPGGELLVPTNVDWASLPNDLALRRSLPVADWEQEYADHVRLAPPSTPFAMFESGPHFPDDVNSWEEPAWRGE